MANDEGLSEIYRNYKILTVGEISPKRISY